MAMNDNVKGALLMSLAMVSFTINDAMIKLVTHELSSGQIMFIRGLFTSVLVLGVAWRMGAMRPIRTLLDPWVALRTAGEIGASVTYIRALHYLPLPNAAAVLQALPLAVTMGAAIFLHEAVGWRRWLAILTGFAGVLIIIRPGTDGFTAASFLVVGSVVSAAARDIATKKIDKAIPSLFISAVTSVAVTITGAVLIVPFGGWQPVNWAQLAIIAFGATMLFAGYQTIIMGLRSGEISFIAPFRYTSLIWAIVLGMVLLGEMPDFYMLMGSTIVILAGLYAFYRESVLQRATITDIDRDPPIA
jgi:drug/metabolite transporter (DMT)-like permease